MIRVFESLRLSSERKLEIVREIKEGSQPSRSFYILLLAASLIASFGLMANSTAVVIGAMLVSPLMTPIIGMSLALVRGNGKLFWRATQAEIFGIENSGGGHGHRHTRIQRSHSHREDGGRESGTPRSDINLV